MKKKKGLPQLPIPASVLVTLRHLIENGAIHLIAYYECVLTRLPCTLSKTWEVHGVTITDEEFSFIASQGTQKPVKFVINAKTKIEKIIAWFIETAKKMIPGRGAAKCEATIPANLVFRAGTTEHVNKRALPA